MDLLSAACDQRRYPDFGDVSISRSRRRRRIAIQLKNDGTVELLAPPDASDSQLKRAFEHFRPWLEKKLKMLAELPVEERPHRFEFAAGGTFYFCGKSYPLQIVENENSKLIKLADDVLIAPTADPREIKLMLEAFYRRHIRRLVTARLEVYSKKFNFAMPRVNINGARRRFGSCNSRKELNFSWHLAMYPMKAIELVVLHECAHFREMNHSPGFYRVLEEYLPDHRQRTEELDKWSRKFVNYPK